MIYVYLNHDDLKDENTILMKVIEAMSRDRVELNARIGELEEALQGLRDNPVEKRVEAPF